MHYAPPFYMRFRFILLMAIVLFAVGFVVSGWFGPNFHVVVPGKAFRSAQPNHDQLRDYRDNHGVKSVINLRGTWKNEDWYDREREDTNSLNLKMIDIALSNFQLPPPEETRRLVESLQQANGPVLLHCRQGADRTSLASAIARLLNGDTLAQARKEFSLWYGFTGFGHGYHLPNLLDLYEKSLAERGLEHNVEHFTEWVDEQTVAYYFAADIEAIEFPRSWKAGIAPEPARFRISNKSAVDWPGDSQPMRLTISLRRLPEKEWTVDTHQTFDRRVYRPGEAFEISVALPSLSISGEYECEADVGDGCGIDFKTMGSTSWQRAIVVRETTNASEN